METGPLNIGKNLHTIQQVQKDLCTKANKATPKTLELAKAHDIFEDAYVC